MESHSDNNTPVSRRKFLQICGTILAGGSIVGLTGLLLGRTDILSDSVPGDSAKRCTAVSAACSTCKVNCPLRKGVTI